MQPYTRQQVKEVKNYISFSNNFIRFLQRGKIYDINLKTFRNLTPAEKRKKSSWIKSNKKIINRLESRLRVKAEIYR